MSFLKFAFTGKNFVRRPKILTVFIRSASIYLQNMQPKNMGIFPVLSSVKSTDQHMRGLTMFPHGHNSSPETENLVSLHLFEKVSEETLETLTEVLDQLLEETYPKEFDVSLSNGVLTVQLEDDGTYVINKQTPNRQIWLSSPNSGPKRYDYIQAQWVYSHDRTSLDDLLSLEFSKILNKPVKIVSLNANVK